MTAHRQMSILRLLRRTSGVLVGCGLLPVFPPAASAAEGTVLTAVSSRVSDDYVRSKLADGSFQAETYAFGKGGFGSGGMRDESIDRMTFMDVARTVAGPLARNNYLPAKDPKTTRLLIMVYWGSTVNPALDPRSITFKLSPRLRALADFQIVNLLGYNSWWEKTAVDPVAGAPIDPIRQHRSQDVVDEVEDNRYFVVLMAYDFQMMWKEKKHKLLWETRFSIRQRHHDFDQQLEPMADFASQYFGQDSHGVIHKPVPEGHVNVGEPKVLGVELETE